jgi:hypothetical protein
LPQTDDTLDMPAGAKWFSTLELKSGYWQVDLNPDDKEKTAFLMGQGLWQSTVMPFGLCDIREVDGDNFKRPHLQLISRVPGRCDHDWLHVPRAPA